MVTGTPSARRRVASWLREEIRGKETVVLTDLVAAAREHLGRDQDFLATLADELLPQMVYDLAQQTIANSRDTRLLLGREDARAGAGKRVLPPIPPGAVRVKWGQWLEHCGGRHLNLMTMTKADLEASATEREGRGRLELRLAAVWRTLAAGLKTGERVGDRFSEGEIDRIACDLNLSVTVTLPAQPALRVNLDLAAD